MSMGLSFLIYEIVRTSKNHLPSLLQSNQKSDLVLLIRLVDIGRNKVLCHGPDSFPPLLAVLSC